MEEVVGTGKVDPHLLQLGEVEACAQVYRLLAVLLYGGGAPCDGDQSALGIAEAGLVGVAARYLHQCGLIGAVDAECSPYRLLLVGTVGSYAEEVAELLIYEHIGEVVRPDYHLGVQVLDYLGDVLLVDGCSFALIYISREGEYQRGAYNGA